MGLNQSGTSSKLAELKCAFAAIFPKSRFMAELVDANVTEMRRDVQPRPRPSRAHGDARHVKRSDGHVWLTSWHDFSALVLKRLPSETLVAKHDTCTLSQMSIAGHVRQTKKRAQNLGCEQKTQWSEFLGKKGQWKTHEKIQPQMGVGREVRSLCMRVCTRNCAHMPTCIRTLCLSLFLSLTHK